MEGQESLCDISVNSANKAMPRTLITVLEAPPNNDSSSRGVTIVFAPVPPVRNCHKFRKAFNYELN